MRPPSRRMLPSLKRCKITIAKLDTTKNNTGAAWETSVTYGAASPMSRHLLLTWEVISKALPVSLDPDHNTYFITSNSVKTCTRPLQTINYKLYTQTYITISATDHRTRLTSLVNKPYTLTAYLINCSIIHHSSSNFRTTVDSQNLVE